MPTINILFENGSGRILSANLATITPIPAGHTITTKTLDKLTDLFEKRIDQPSLDLVDKNFLQIDSDILLPIEAVRTVVFTKRDGETKELLDDVLDNDTILISARSSDQTFDEDDRQAFFEVLQTALLQGAGQVKIATGLAPGKETIVLFNDTLTPVFQVLDYV